MKYLLFFVNIILLIAYGSFTEMSYPNDTFATIVVWTVIVSFIIFVNAILYTGYFFLRRHSR